MISVCFITKNEEKWLGECISHLRPIVGEFIVLDTGSTDRTVEIAKQSGAKVFEAPWPGDFAKARNMSLQHATGDWILKIDPDERLDPRDFDRLVALTKTDKVAYQCWSRAYTNDANRIMLQSFRPCTGEYPEQEKNYRGYIEYPNIRLFRRLPGVKFVGRIHETVEPTLPGWENGISPVPPALNIPFHHYGQNDAAVQEKGKDTMYSKLLREELDSNPENWYVLFEVANELFNAQKWDEAIAYFERANAAHPRKPQILSNWGYAKVLQGKCAEGEAILKDCLKLDPTYHDAWLNLGASRMTQNDYAAALFAFDHCLKILPNSYMAFRAKGQCLAQIGKTKDAVVAFERALEILPFFNEAKVDLAILLSHLGQSTKAKEMAYSVLQDEPQNPRARALFDQAHAWN